MSEVFAVMCHQDEKQHYEGFLMRVFSTREAAEAAILNMKQAVDAQGEPCIDDKAASYISPEQTLDDDTYVFVANDRYCYGLGFYTIERHDLED